VNLPFRDPPGGMTGAVVLIENEALFHLSAASGILMLFSQ
jgi:hypothetical protein